MYQANLSQFTATTFPILASLPVADNASALAFFIFIRSFFQVGHVLTERESRNLDFTHASSINFHRYGVSPSAQPCCKINSKFGYPVNTSPLYRKQGSSWYMLSYQRFRPFQSLLKMKFVPHLPTH